MVRKRLKKHPGMHVYHYAAYEKSTLLRLAGRYGVGEHDVDELLRNGVLVDLYPLVRKSIRVGTESYSIKYLEPLYMGNELRSGEVTTATDSITQYARFCALRDEGPRRRGRDRAQGDRGLQPLRLPVHAQAARLAGRTGHRVRRSAPRSATGGRLKRTGGLARRRESRTGGRTRTPTAQFAGDGIDERTPEQTAVAMVAAARGFHKREDKPFWWAHFDRVNNPVDEWADNSDVFIADRTEIVADWHQPPQGTQAAAARPVDR